jgi:hypothetical protein
MKVKTIHFGRLTIYQLRDDREILSAASDIYLDYVRNRRSNKVPRHLKILCDYRTKKIEEINFGETC